jgi:DNA polymerase III subunit delta'
VPGFESITDQDRPIRILTTFLQKGTVPHALLFTGIEGVGKQSTAVTFAMACNCTGNNSENKSGQVDNQVSGGDSTRNRSRTTIPCVNCRSCRKIESNSHPDIIRIKPSGVFIKIDQIRTLCQTLALKPYEARTRVVLISDAQAMNPAAGNALLKVLEEPPTGTVLILVANHTSDLLPTIVSRCRHIRFNPISNKNIESALVHEHGLDPEIATIIAAMAGGSLSQALHMYRTNWINRRNWLISELDSLSSKSIGRLLAFGEQLARNKDAVSEVLEVMKSWLRDLVIGKIYPEKIIHQDLAQNAHKISQKMSINSLLSKIDTIQSTQNAIQTGTNIRLAMEIMVLKLSRI